MGNREGKEDAGIMLAGRWVDRVIFVDRTMVAKFVIKSSVLANGLYICS